jgi:hypothetical protein
LVAQAARSAVNADDDVVLMQSHCFRRGGVKNLRNSLHFQIVIAGAQRSHFFELALLGLPRNAFGFRADCPPALFNALKILLVPVTLLHGPLRAAQKHFIHLALVEPNSSRAADSGGHAMEQGLGKVRFI